MAESESDIRITTDTPHLAHMGELWGVCCEDFGEIDRILMAPHCISHPPIHNGKYHLWCNFTQDQIIKATNCTQIIIQIKYEYDYYHNIQYTYFCSLKNLGPSRDKTSPLVISLHWFPLMKCTGINNWTIQLTSQQGCVKNKVCKDDQEDQ